MSPSFVIKRMQRFEATGDVATAQFGGFKRSPLLEHEQAIRDWLEETPDLTIAELRVRLAERGTKTSPAAMCRYLEKRELTRKIRPPGRPRNRKKLSPRRVSIGATSR